MTRRRAAVDAWMPLPRPARLSDPYAEFLYHTGRLAELANVPLDGLCWLDVRHLFCAPEAGTFPEVAYFLPGALALLERDTEHAGEVLAGLIGWVGQAAPELDALGVRGRVEGGLSDMLEGWTREFRVRHFDCDACRAKGWVIDYNDIVECSELVQQALIELVATGAFAHVAEDFVASLARARSALEAAWFLDVAREQLTGLFHLRPVDETARELERRLALERLRRPTWAPQAVERLVASLDRHRSRATSARVLELVRDRALLQRAATRLGDLPALTASPTYWRDTRIAVGLDAPA